jgi:hypothetical protein
MSNLRDPVGPDHNKTEWVTEPALASLQPSNNHEIKSPRSDIIVSEWDPEAGHFIRRVCPSCRRFIETDEIIKRGAPFFKQGVGDPLYFMSAGVKYRSLIVPYWGRVAFHKWSNWEEFREHFSYDQKREWSDKTGVPFPYAYFE